MPLYDAINTTHFGTLELLNIWITLSLMPKANALDVLTPEQTQCKQYILDQVLGAVFWPRPENESVNPYPVTKAVHKGISFYRLRRRTLKLFIVGHS